MPLYLCTQAYIIIIVVVVIIATFVVCPLQIKPISYLRLRDDVDLFAKNVSLIVLHIVP